MPANVTPKDRYRLNSDGIAYAWAVITLFVILFGILIAWFNGPLINSLLNGPNGDQSVGINHDLLAGRQSEQSRGAIQFNIDFATNIPIFVVLSILAYAVGRAIVVKKVP